MKFVVVLSLFGLLLLDDDAAVEASPAPLDHQYALLPVEGHSRSKRAADP